MENNFKDKKILLMGLGIHGGALALAKWLLKRKARLTITDLKDAKQLKKSLDELEKVSAYKDIKFTLGRHDLADFANQDLIIKNPGVPQNSKYLKHASKKNIPIVNEAVMFFGLFPGESIGVTGTRGKSTTASLINKILKNKIKDNVLAGNIATKPMFQVLDKLSPKSMPVLELSSWHLDDLHKYKKSPHIAVVTNVMVDHLNTYKNFNAYKKAKSYLVNHQGKDDIAILNWDNMHTKSFAKLTKAQKYYFSLKQKVKGVYVKQDVIYFNDGKKIFKVANVSDLYLKGEHNLSNALAAICVAKILKVANKDIQKTLSTFKGVDYRFEYKGKIGSIEVYNDSTATTPDAAIAAIRSLGNKHILMIAGGEDKVLDYKYLAQEIKDKVCFLVLLEGSASKLLYKELKKINFPAYRMISRIDKLSVAWKMALKYARKDGCTILFSPAAASFNMFLNEFDRARQFDKLFYASKAKTK